MDFTVRCRQIANSYYNLGLSKAKDRDLSGAAECLKKSIHFYKYQTDARNLLGLIYYEMGETGMALVQWIISSNLQPVRNRAGHYLDDVQSEEGRLKTDTASIKRYNQALMQAQDGSTDLAVLQLSRIVEHSPNYVRALMLLSLLYINTEEYTKAGKYLQKILKIDKYNPQAQIYMSIVKENTGREEAEQRRFNKVFSHRQMQDDDIILPPTYKENTGWQTVFNIFIGLLLGAAVIFFLVMPTVRETLNTNYNQELKVMLDEIGQKNLEIDNLEDNVASLQEDSAGLQERLLYIDGQNQSQIEEYQLLVEILEAYNRGDFTQAVLLYTQLDPGNIEDEQMQAVIASIRVDMESSGYQVLADLAAESYSSGNTELAIDYYQRSLDIFPDNPQVMYDLSMVYDAGGQEDEAKELWGQLIMEYPNTDVARLAREARGY